MHKSITDKNILLPLTLAILSLGSVSTALSQTARPARSRVVAAPAPPKDADAILVSDAEFASIQKTMGGSSPYGNTWIQPYGGIVAEPGQVKPAILVGGLWARDTVTVQDSKGNKIVGIPADIAFLRDHWTVAHKAANRFGIGRFGWTFGVSTGTLGSSSGNSTGSSTDYFFGITYFINPEMTVALGPISDASTGFANCHIAATVSIDLSTLGKLFGGK